jgi:BirA family biotin operon repressor/biotin-[acetyl-CoA-carboxylase] ligase
MSAYSHSWPGSLGLSVLDEIDSTNAEALRRAASGQGGPHWFMARRQTGGRGRQGRRWHSIPGNLLATLLLTVEVPAAILPQLSLVAALAAFDMVSEALRKAANPLTPVLKWPNDLLLEGAKCCGILLETAAGGAQTSHVALGFGVNLAHAPEDEALKATSLRNYGIELEPEAALDQLARAMLARLTQWDEGRGFVHIRQSWLRHAHNKGQMLQVRQPGASLSGTFETLDEHGALILRTGPDSTSRILAGDIWLTESTRSNPTR